MIENSPKKNKRWIIPLKKFSKLRVNLRGMSFLIWWRYIWYWGITSKYIEYFSHRHRRTETEEDEELISQAKKSAAVVTRFEESPSCKIYCEVFNRILYFVMFTLHKSRRIIVVFFKEFYTQQQMFTYFYQVISKFSSLILLIATY